MRCLMTIKVLDPSEFRDIFGNLEDYSPLAHSLKKDKMTVGIFSEDEDETEDQGLIELINDSLDYFKIEKVENKDLKEYDLEKEWCSWCAPSGC